jgi:hypothetical protein
MQNLPYFLGREVLSQLIKREECPGFVIEQSVFDVPSGWPTSLWHFQTLGCLAYRSQRVIRATVTRWVSQELATTSSRVAQTMNVDYRLGAHEMELMGLGFKF